MSSAATKRRFTPKEYLALERRSETRNEFYNGEIFAMSGASREHNLISVNVLRDIGNQLEDRPCEAYTSDMRVSVEATRCSIRRSSSKFSRQRPRPTIGVSSSATTGASFHSANSF
jgi:Uma2 family endonuclease